jgi:surface polysaccharide O-acyltransferase-like enzyme
VGIDLLRGLSILLVVVHHIALRIPLKDGWLAQWLPRSLLNAFACNGYEAVFLYFVVSGFLSAGADAWSGFLWYAPVVLLCWMLGALLARTWSIPCDRALRRCWLPRPATALAIPD